MRRTLHLYIGLVLLTCLVVATSHAQAPSEIERFKSPDTNNAVIEGRVTLPSGFSADRNVKITLKNSQSILSTLYSNKHGEFRFDNLSEGIYFVQAEIEGPDFEPRTERVALGRGMVWRLTVQLTARQTPQASRYAVRVVSTAELQQSVPAPAKKEYERGLRFVKKGDFRRAAHHFQEAISLYPEYLAARNDLGAQHLKLSELDDAERQFKLVLERDPKNFNAQFNLGLVRVERLDFLDAINQLQRAVALDVGRPVARLWLGFALLQIGDMGNAERQLTRALIMGGSECVAAHYHLARIYLLRGDNVEAARSLQAYLTEAPKGEYVKEASQLAQELKARQ